MIACALRAGVLLLTVVTGASALGDRAVAQRASGESGPAFSIDSGPIQGAMDGDVFTFKGIPYAEPPTGDRRWRAPQPVASWTNVRKANAYGSACIQVPGLSAANGGEPGPLSEDCLYLNVWTPSLQTSAKLPVIVWIHGGAYIFGAGGLPIYTGAPLAKRGAIVVNVNYRLAQLGFFAHPAIEKSDPGGPANFGLLDQISALKWVQRNIERFGGDPGNVTIMGQSAGAKSVLALYASPLARGLFHKGVALSSYVVPDVTRAKAGDVGIKVASALGLDGANASIEDLRRVPAERFGQLKGQGLSNSPVLIAGDEALPRSVEDIFSAGKEASLPLIVGSTSDDVSVVTAFGFQPKTVLDKLGLAKVLVRVLYPKAKDDDQVARQTTRDLVFTMPARWIADRHSKIAPTWRYYFDYTPVRSRPKFPDGVPHGSELPYALNTVDIFEGTKDIVIDRDRRFSRTVSEYWLQFARSGRPSSKLGPSWPDHRRGQDRTMIFADEIAVQSNFMRPRLDVFIGVTKIIDTILKRD
jgi:para-nitrobenzyl esterase